MRDQISRCLSLLGLAVVAQLWGCASSGLKLPESSTDVADVSLPVPLPAPRDGSDVSEGTVHFEGRPAQERLTEAGTRKQLSDDRLTTEILASIVDDPAVDPFQFRYRVDDGRVEIRGKGSERQKRRVGETVRRVRGVRGVENEVQSSVDPEDPPTESSRGEDDVTLRSDEEIEREVRDAIEKNPRADFSQILIYCREGVVALRGMVPNLRTLQAMEQSARTVPGVRRLVSRLQVKVWRVRSDERLARDVRAALALDPAVSEQGIRVRVHQGAVELSGEVTSAWKKDQAARMCAEVWGVSSIVNRIQVARFPSS